MIKSMTGYGYGYSFKDDVGIGMEIKSTNHRYLDIFFRVPKELQFWEENIRSKIKEKVNRGHLDIRVTIESMPEEVYSISVNRPLVIAYYEALNNIRDLLELEGKIKLEHILNFKDIFETQDRLADDERMSSVIEESVEEALKNLLAQKAKEGGNLENDLKERCEKIQDYASAVNEKIPSIQERYREKLQQKLKELEGGNFEEDRILTECAIIAERSDITEEIVRVKNHLQLFRESLEATGAIGRKLDFILQEMFREINTIGSKAGDSEISGYVVVMKAELEKMREQVQNIE